MSSYRLAAFGCWNNRYNRYDKDDTTVYLNLVMEVSQFIKI